MSGPDRPENDVFKKPPIAASAEHEETADKSREDIGKVIIESSAFKFDVYYIADRLNNIMSGNVPHTLDPLTEKAISETLCAPFLPDADKIPAKDRLSLNKALTNILINLKELDPDLAEAVECAAMELLEGLKPHTHIAKEVAGDIAPDNGDNIERVLSKYADDSASTGSSVLPAVEVFARKTIDQLRMVLNELRSCERFDDLSNDSKMAILGSGPHTYNDFIKWCGDDVIDEYCRLISQIHTEAEEKGGVLYSMAFKKPLEKLIEFLQKNK